MGSVLGFCVDLRSLGAVDQKRELPGSLVVPDEAVVVALDLSHLEIDGYLRLAACVIAGVDCICAIGLDIRILGEERACAHECRNKHQFLHH